ncbi:DUF5134 domain-containing protein [Streptomyces sp. DH37]|uniref:DUF5134 domain-containing protein n=1 Tax=Streptomyces sp. DH37 TaxID=3040122 RepID=UPI002442B23F|nr:DUF5134 domain-containing protein [Streptomyces sp. DH37]MDG9701029.1 DUF5134 domain-containing protein [Streptomyces sp. DH37]
MHGPEPVGWMLVALCGGVGAYCLRRVRGGTPGQRRAAAGEALMGFGMAAMALPASAAEPLPPAVLGAVLGAVFGGAAVYELVLALLGPEHRPHHLHHVVGALAMVHMALAMAAGPAGAHAHHTAASGAPAEALTGALLAYFALYVLLAGARLVPVPGPAGAAGVRRAGSPDAVAAGGPPRLPELAAACRLSMGMGMFAMLLTL